jgi:hypothetical protein
MPSVSRTFPGTHRGRLFVRDCGATRMQGAARTMRSHRTYAMVGVMEVPDAAGWRREHVHDFSLLATPGGFMLSFEGDGRPLPDHACATDLGVLQHDVEPRAPTGILASLGWGGGAMVLRDTRAPSPAGTTLVQVMMLASVPDGVLPDAHMAGMSIHSRSDGSARPATGALSIEGPCTGFEHRGASMSQIQKAPLWGWAEEPHGFASSLRLDVVDKCTRLQELMVSDDPDPGEVADLRRATMSAVQDNSDPVYASFRRRIAAEGHMLPWDATPTASDTMTRSRAMSMLVAELLKAA